MKRNSHVFGANLSGENSMLIKLVFEPEPEKWQEVVFSLWELGKRNIFSFYTFHDAFAKTSDCLLGKPAFSEE